MQPLIVQRFVVRLQQMKLVLCLFQRLILCSCWHMIRIMLMIVMIMSTSLGGASTGRHAAAGAAMKFVLQTRTCKRITKMFKINVILIEQSIPEISHKMC